ncbi:MAG: hypothetical protein IKB71_08190 [Lentisphaeria bacterium]|nr:hypothetical protein [Lentisphaeria bacterium]
MKRNILKKIFFIEEDTIHKIIYILGIKIRIRKHSKRSARISDCAAREIYSAIEVSKLHSKVFPPFKHCNIDQNVTIIGCGPTVQFYNNEADYINIALNKAILLDNINFKYSFAFDGELQETCPGYIDIIKNKKYIKFIGKFLHPDIKKNFPEIKHAEQYKIYRYYAAKRHGFPNLRKFEDELHTDISTYPLADFYSISFAALQFALYTYPDKIYLVGLDTAQTGNFFNADGVCRYLDKKMLKGYKIFKEFAAIHYPETEIISINPVGLKGIFSDMYTRSYAEKYSELNIPEDKIIKTN